MSAHPHNLAERGFTVLTGYLDAEEVRTLRQTIERLVSEIRPPRFFAAKDEELGDGVFITTSGLAISRLLDARPALRPLLLRPALLDALRETWEGGIRLELAGALVSDQTRPFFRWHSHLHGLDEGLRYRAQHWPPSHRVERVLTLLYLDNIDDETGPLYIHPRRVGDETAPAFSLDQERWPGMVELRPRAGTLVAIEQATWHAAKSLTRPGLRILIGCYFAVADAPCPTWADPRLIQAPLL